MAKESLETPESLAADTPQKTAPVTNTQTGAAEPDAQAKAGAADKPAKGRVANRRARDTTPKSMPFLEQTATLKSFHAQQVYRRTYTIGEEALFTLSVILRALASEEECIKVDEVVNQKIAELQKAIFDEQARLEKLADTYGIQASGIPYSAPLDVTVKVTSPRAVAWMSIIRDLDRLVELFDVLWLSHVIKDGEHAKGIFTTKRKVWRMANELRTLAIRSIASAQRRDIDNVTDPRSGTALDADQGKQAPVAQDIDAAVADATEHAEEEAALAA
ncbi:AcaB family transcriptional regulator [Diaphorobacter sp. J5-51]|uniref:AcaB family transcriptional regulator n=1 Tax=Diaphorobacter sp. J5-51 TaxID=680496 RepID=UPI0006429038|nr:AcaB family transcriptional regulator [Diaphorobacter sp. J5-51]KLR59012.1 hypothetical protein OX89_04310 [Diaphorobacter sp. J5-51]